MLAGRHLDPVPLAQVLDSGLRSPFEAKEMNELLSAHLNSVIIGGKLETSWTGLPRKSVADRALPGPLSGLSSTRTRALPRAVIRPSILWGDGVSPRPRDWV